MPGTMVAGRYRVVGLLGRGGMGEVYRADDLRLGQPVALKFLRPEAHRDPTRHQAFLDEVRMAVRVTHPNVCRIHDVGDADGQPFLSMEYVDGEDLASLLRRIGRLPQDKAIEIARQLCAGIAAAHEQKILHRDLKPANVMLDGRGQVKVMDFGLAGLEQGIDGSAIAGTPAYMAPEQLAGGELTARSDVYSLGLVLYELFTGKRVHAGRTLAEIRREQLDSQPSSPTTHVADLDPAIERVILQCLEREPADRPASARAIAAAMPGGNPLAAALAAGETPSPELVAATGRAGIMAPWVATLCALIVAGCTVVAVHLAGYVQLARLAPLTKPPEALIEIARQKLTALGYGDRDGYDSAYGFAIKSSYIAWLKGQTSQDPREWWRHVQNERPGPLQFYYRESPEPMVPLGLWRLVSPSNPPLSTPGMRLAAFDAQGRMEYLETVPSRTIGSVETPNTAPAALFAAAELEMSEFEAVAPEHFPPSFATERLAWEGPCPGVDGHTMRLEASFHEGRPVYLEQFTPWKRDTPLVLSRVAEAVQTGIFVAGCVGAGLLALRNLRSGRGHRRGAFRLAMFVFCLFMPASFTVVRSDFLGHLGSAAFHGFLVWMFYIALEPAVRRMWPATLVSWIRLLDGRWRDPLVGSHLVVGCVYGVLAVLVQQGAQVWPKVTPDMTGIQMVALHSPAFAFEKMVAGVNTAILPILLGVVLLVLLQMVVRRRWLTVSVVCLLGLLAQAQAGPIAMAWTLLGLTLFFVVLLRFGLLPTVVGHTVQGLFFLIPLTFDTSAWYFGRSLMVFLFVAAITIFGAWVSVSAWLAAHGAVRRG